MSYNALRQCGSHQTESCACQPNKDENGIWDIIDDATDKGFRDGKCTESRIACEENTSPKGAPFRAFYPAYRQMCEKCGRKYGKSHKEVDDGHGQCEDTPEFDDGICATQFNLHDINHGG